MTAVHPVAPDIRAGIETRLADIEAEHGVRVLFACESGSRGWGFASPDSDYDVRFLYVHPLPWYVQVSAQRDVIELPVTGELDISGWELRKALGLLKKGNATLNEWLASPVIYRADAGFVCRMRDAVAHAWQPQSAFRHYLHLARGQYRQYLRGETVRFKKYLYALRPLLAAEWIAQGRGQPPMAFQALIDDLVEDARLCAAIDTLLTRKRAASEQAIAPPIPQIQAFIETALARLEATSPLPGAPIDFGFLDRLLLETVMTADMEATP